MNSIFMEYLDRTRTSGKVKKLTVYSVAFAVLMAVLALFKGVLPGYLIMAIPALIVNQIIICYGCSQGAKKACIGGLCVLNLCAAMTQAVFGLGDGEAAKTYFFLALGVAAAVVFGYVMRKWCNKEGLLIVLSAAGALVCLGLCLVMPEVNGARAWLSFQGKPIFQLTEVAKFAYVLFIGLLFSQKYTDGAKFFLSLVVTGLSVMILVVINELGTLLVIGLSFLCVALIKFKQNVYKLVLIALVGVMLLLAWGGYSAAEKRLDNWRCPECQALNDKTTECRECEAKMPAGGFNFKCPTCRYTTWGDQEIEPETANCALCDEDGFFDGIIGRLCKKIYDRTSVTYNYELVKGSGSAYHMEQNQQSIKAGRLFGDNDAIVYVPNVDTDSVIAGLMNRLGLIFALIILVAFFAVFYSAYTASSPLRIMAICAFVFQALLTFCGTLNLLPMAGVGVPLISRGGSNLIISYLLIYIMITAVRDNREESV